MNTEPNFDFQDIERQSAQTLNRLTSQNNNGFQVSIDRNLKEIDYSSRQLNESTLQKIDGLPSNKEITSKYNIDNKANAKNLSNISTSSFTEVKVVQTDVNEFLKANFEKMIWATIEQTQKQTLKQFEDNYERTTLSDWNKEKKRLEETLGQKFIKAKQSTDYFSGSFGPGQQSMYKQSTATGAVGGGASMMFGKSFGASQSMYAQSISVSPYTVSTYMSKEERTKLSLKMKQYADVVRQFMEYSKSSNMVSQQDRPRYQLVDNLSQVHCSDDHDIRIADSWKLIKMISEDTKKKSSSTPTPFSLNNNSSVNNSILTSSQLAMKTERYQTIISASLEFLQDQWYEFIKTKVPSNSNQSKPEDVIITFLQSNNPFPQIDQSKLSDKLKVEGNTNTQVSLYAVVYQLLRCGHYREAREILTRCAKDKVSDEITSALQLVIDGIQVPQDKKKALSSEARYSSDPFKTIVCQILSDGVNSQNKLATSVQDYLWWRLFMVKENQVQLQSVQEEINDHIKSNGSNFPDYDKFQWLLCTNQLESAIIFLWQLHPEDSIHFAIALQNSRLLNAILPQPPFSSNEICNSTCQNINFTALLKQYINKDFTPDIDKSEIFDYYMLIPDRDNRISAISDLIVSIGNERVKFIEDQSQLGLVTQQDWNDIISQSAIILESRNDYISSMDLWLIAQDLSRVLEIFNSKISPLLNSPLPERPKLLEYGYKSIEHMKSICSSRQEKSAHATFEKLLWLCEYFNLYQDNRYRDAMDKMDQIGLLPRDINSIDKKAQEYLTTSQHVTRNFSIILSSYIDILIKQYNLLNSSIGGTNFLNQVHRINDGILGEMSLIQQRATVIYTFTGKIDFQLPGNTLTQLMNFIFKTQ
ncbi:nucleoporin 93 [Tieghemostelium lacteum]|uniref:Nuclear pore protein n=1 Tax=Tieghemostelium lacteum TaxID=361077 RepID=A0A151ZCY1_TIELA|nr:nucleoporin 93 [Tieghemostelium lacteum]|eukprot:KYQ91800.1 nucleoporin 93 [Tieghemostelium lacteum]